MSDFLKKIVPPPGSAPRGKKVIIQDIIPKRRAEETKIKKIEKPETEAAPVKEYGEKEKYAPPKEAGLPELPVKRWEPTIRPVFALKRLKVGRRPLYLLGIAAFIAAIIVISTSFAKLEIAIRPISADITVPPTNIIADTKILAINPETKKIPGLKITIEKTYQETFPSSGKKYIEDLAKGRINIYNAFSSAPQILVAGTRLMEPGGKIFKLTKAITIPGAKIDEGKIIPSALEAEVLAEKAGEEYNIAPTDFSIPGLKGTPKYAAFYGKSANAFYGGFKGEARVATANDIKSAQEKATQALFNQLKATLQEKLPAGDEFVMLDGSRSILIRDVKNPKSDERADNFAVSAEGVAEMLIFKKSDLLALLEKILLSPERPSAILSSSFKPSYQSVKLDTKNSQLAFVVEGEALAMRIIPTDEIKAAAVSKTTPKLETYLRNRPEIAGFVIKNFPIWRWRAPKNPDAIEVRIEVPGD